MSYRFHPLREAPDVGIIVDPDGEARPARFMTLAEARAHALSKLRREDLRLLEKLRTEAKLSSPLA